MNFSKVVLIAFGISIFSIACKKEGLGGKSSVSGAVKHHAQIVPGAVVYIKYGAVEFPGADILQYDASTVSDAAAHYEFNELQKGDYYLYATGYDSLNMQYLDGGGPVVLKKNQAKPYEIAISEE